MEQFTELFHGSPHENSARAIVFVNSIIHKFLPPIIVSSAKWLQGKLRVQKSRADIIAFTGCYSAWSEALNDSLGYNSEVILQKTRKAVLKVKNGEAAYERDSVLFDRVQYEFPLIAGLSRAALADGGRLSVMDFGGALGSTYFQCRKFLSPIQLLRWSVVEQPSHVACGREEIANEQLRFYLTIDECLQTEHPNVLLLSSVLQYLPKPYDFLADALRHGFPHVIVDRTGFLCSGEDRLTVQQVPDSIYAASYPAWFLSEEKFLARFRPEYELIARFEALDKLHPEGEKAEYKGFIFQRRSR